MQLWEVESLCRVALRCFGCDAGMAECHQFATKNIGRPALEVESDVVEWASAEARKRWAEVGRTLNGQDMG